MKISVVIPDRKDLRVEHLITNLYQLKGDNFLEIIIALNSPSNDLLDLVKKLEEKYKNENFIVRSCNAGESGNVSRAYNVGIDNSTYDHVLILDSDVTVADDFFINIAKWIPTYDVVKAYLNFEDSNRFLAKTINKSRMANTSNVLELFSPGIMFNKTKIKMILGNKIYDEEMKLTGDCDFSMRVRKHNSAVAAKENVGIDYRDAYNVSDETMHNLVPEEVFNKSSFIRVVFDRNSKFYHPSFRFMKDIKDALIYGAERRIIINKNLKKFQPIKNLAISINDSRQYGFAVCAYNFIWSFAMEVGTVTQKYFNVRDFLMKR